MCHTLVSMLNNKQNLSSIFFFNDTATTEIYTLSLHDALPIYLALLDTGPGQDINTDLPGMGMRSEEHTSELQSHSDLVCRLLLEKKKNQQISEPTSYVLNPPHAQRHDRPQVVRRCMFTDAGDM